MGGEKDHTISIAILSTGSPPRGRGKGLQDRLARQPQGITPAWAGKRESLSRCSSFTWDHPRVGGEKKAFRPATGRPLGSPPRGRGKEFSQYRVSSFAGITPAWAGKSREWPRGLTRAQDHPRVGGEKIVLRIKVEVIEGSPPRGRGKVDFLAEDPARAGITPAWAGKSLVRVQYNQATKDHPRVGGEKTKKIP